MKLTSMKESNTHTVRKTSIQQRDVANRLRESIHKGTLKGKSEGLD